MKPAQLDSQLYESRPPKSQPKDPAVMRCK